MSTETHPKRNPSQYSLRATLVLMVASMVWIWIFKEMRPLEIAILAGFALAAGLVGHVVYSFWLPWRVSVLATVLLIYNLCLGTQFLLQSASRPPWRETLTILWDVLIFPAEMLTHTTAARDVAFMLLTVAATLIFSAAHSIRPCLPTAIVTALGVAIWYGVSLMIMAAAG